MEQYNVTGMSCAACSARVEKAVSKVPGVTACSVSLLTNSMGVEGSASAQEMANMMVGREADFHRHKSEAHFGKEVLEVKNLTVLNEHHFPVVKKVSFSIHAGEIFAIAGVSGNGQTEIADAVTGLAAASEGQVLLNGKDITHAAIRSRAQEGISYIPEDRQSTGVVMDFSLSDNLE